MTQLSVIKDKLAVGVKAAWQSPSNIALVKYWGKKDFQIPANPSLSITLDKAFTSTSVTAYLGEKASDPSIDFFFEGHHNQLFSDKIQRFINSLKPDFDYLKFAHFKIESSNSFPHSAGIASSASSMSALALCLLDIDMQLKNMETDNIDFYKKASAISRLGSGSACRSIYGGYTVWGKHHDFINSVDEFATPIDFEPAEIFNNINDSILIVSQEAKSVSSRAGHELMNGHPYAQARYNQAINNLSELKLALKDGNWDSFASITENEALSLHAMMLSSKPGYILMHANTLNIVELICEFRKQNKAKVCFTLDAGPNIHLLYPDGEKLKIEELLSQLVTFCHNGKIIRDRIGKGPINKFYN